MKLTYYLCDPSGNLTALVTSRHDPADYPAINDQILKQHPRCEQVGFVDLSGDVPYLRMAGGEFCGNATLCAVVLFCHTRADFRPVSVRVYGVDSPLCVEVTPTGNGYKATVSLPRPDAIERYQTVLDGIAYDFPCVSQTGIVHVIAPYDLPAPLAETLAKRLAEDRCRPAAGVMLYDRRNGRLKPLVYVVGVDTLFWEKSCASGSFAVCAYEAYENGGTAVCRLQQPGGVLFLSAASGWIRLTNTVFLAQPITKEWEP